ncbi:DUF6443 domain-containing protein [Bacteroides ovatus]|uniref:DUF6443 domain-containing protein n=2 Tax=Bacteroides ovatus TaxID=28116 RepID=UPI00189BAE51|nr:DUF6443 domain-containing protein [Bacteroides ovatus]MDC2624448.1 DUF6443 domain-containing protein [Bacteroides ovatus]MDC2638358.1 DUF6443 domain-containing protein [Bacteroides ovatus]
MKHILFYLLMGILFSTESNAQTPKTLAGSLPTDKNHIVSRTYTHTTGSTWQDKIEYYDGLGRPEQSVSRYSHSANNVITYQEYDIFGRISHQWLPVSLSDNDGKFILPDEVKNKATMMYGDASPYSRPIYETSPLNRILEQYGPGEDWQQNGRSAKSEYLSNISTVDTLNCLCFSTTYMRDTIAQINRTGNYQSGQLYVTRIEDEDGNSSFEFKDKLQQVVLTRRIEQTESGKELYDTYYIYDNFGNLTAVLPPAASSALANNNTGSWNSAESTVLRNYAYLYLYDSRHRCIAKKLPGCDWTFYVYDKTDQQIFSQDGNQRKLNEWSFSIPDLFGRECISGICANSLNPFSNPLRLQTVRVSWFSETASTPGNGIYKGYYLSGTALESPVVLSVNYYDDYSFLGKNGLPDLTNSNVCYDSEAEVENFGIQYTAAPKGLLTGKLVASLNESKNPSYLYTVLYYDDHDRIIQSKSSNHLSGGTEKEYIAYDFVGNPIKRKHVHLAADQPTQTENYAYTYDYAGRLSTVTHRLNNKSDVILTNNEYDELGRLLRNKRSGHTNLQTDYMYNIRSWIKSINGPLFSQTLNYQEPVEKNIPCYNGNISSLSWKTGSDTNEKGYQFTYDPLSRLKNAVYEEGNLLNHNTNNFTEQITGYDKNGNILGLKRYGQTAANGYGLVDNLTITLNGNQLKRVDDSVSGSAFGDNFDFKDGAKQSTEYFYDANGNLLKDLNKKINDIQYNYLNLPDRIEFEDGSSISYLYDAAGTKLRVVHSIAGNTTTTDYCGKVIYENGIPKTLLTEAGFVSLNDNKYHYYLQDHQGNNRVVADQAGAVEEVNHYYPFGGIFASTSSVQPYKYNGKELDRKGGLDWYDYGARMYDAALGRWHGVDPMADKYYGISPYNYCLNNPFRLIDPNGMWPGDPLLQPFGRYQYGSNAALNTLKFIHNTVASAVNTPINMINGLADETQYIYNSGVGSYLSSGTKNIGDAVSSELSYRINTPVSQQASDTWQAMKDPENWENATATAVLMLSPMKGGNTTSAGRNVFAVAKEGTEVMGKSLLDVKDVVRIENAAKKIGKPIHVVGSRASGKATAYSDWDYIIEGLTNKNWKSIKNSLPGARSIIDNVPRNIDIIKEPLDITKPYIKINPK